MPLNSSQSNELKKQKKVIKLDKKKADVPKEDIKDVLKGYDPEDLIFALDIGTRTIVGIVGITEKDVFKVIAAEVAVHKNRAMLDGQIHDIMQVAEVAKEVKEKIEKSIGVQLKKVAIAAAGRVLKTCQVKAEREIDSAGEITQEIVGSIEMEAIQLAQLKLDEEISKEEKTQFYCVGYSVINYFLNGYIISSLVGHRGRKVGADVLATFLPHIVVDSLYTVMHKIGLEVISLTLEPIAAINVTIPKDLRLLNLALVDIGAGTSDIAITKDGTVVAYAMAPIAGDEITEKIAQHYLVDFNTGEKIKISLSQKADNITFVDILGKKHSVKRNEAMEVVKPVMEALAETISRKILEYNGKSPNAVFLIGGGSQLPGFTEMVAEQLKLPNERVVVRGRDIIHNINYKGKKLSGPEAITPFGIAVTAQMQRGQDFLCITVDGKKVRLFNSKKLMVADALILVGYNPSQLIGRTGKGISFEVNGESRFLRGEHGKPAEIYVNEIPASLETELKVGDSIRIVPAVDGKDAEAKVSDFIAKTEKIKVTFNGSQIDVGSRGFINGNIKEADSLIKDKDVVEISEINHVGELIKLFEIGTEGFDIYVNSYEVEEGYRLKDGDVIECKKKCLKEEVLSEKETEFRKEEYEMKAVKGLVNFDDTMPDKNRDMPNAGVDEVVEPVKRANSEDGESTFGVLINGNMTHLKGNKSQYIFVDVFNYINFDLSKPKGNIILKLNGKKAGFTDVIKPGDVIDIYWDQ